jgi:hypothetical protein
MDKAPIGFSSSSNCCCYRCKSGCIHLSCGNASLQFNYEQFIELVGVVNSMYRQIIKETEGEMHRVTNEESLVM